MNKQTRRFSLFAKFLVVMVALAVVPLVLVGTRMIDINRVALQESILSLHLHLAQALADKINDYITNLGRNLGFVIAAQKTRGFGWLDRQAEQETLRMANEAVLKSLLIANEDFLTISLVDRRGREVMKVWNPKLGEEPKLGNFSNDEVFQKAQRSTRPELSDIIYEKYQPRLNLAYPLGDGNVLYLNISLERLWREVYKTTFGRTGFAYLVNSSGRVIAHPDIERAANKLDVSGLAIIQRATSRRALGSEEFVGENSKVLIGAYAPVRNTGWSVIIQQPKDEAYASAIAMRRNALTWIAISIVAAAVIAFWFARGLSKPIVKLISAAKRVASGDFSTQVKVKTRDELLTLAETFNLMTSELKRYDDLQVDKRLVEKARADAILFSIEDGIIMTDYDGNIVLSNERAKRMVDLKKFTSDERIEQAIVRVKENPETPVREEIDLSTPGISRIFRSTVGQVQTDKGKGLGLVTVVHDITLEKELERLKDDFTHGITHDLKGPLTAINGYLEVLMDGSAGELNDQQKEFLHIISDSSDRLVKLVNDILDVAKLESGRMPVTLETVQFDEVVMSAVKVLKPLTESAKVKLEVNVPGNLQTLEIDRRLIERVVANLGTNAIKFTPPDGVVRISAKTDKSKLVCLVEDTGRGMPPDQLEKIFDKFSQVSRDDRFRGTGLGLTISRYIVEAHHGKIWAESELGKGSKFIFQIPLGLVANEKGEIVCGSSH